MIKNNYLKKEDIDDLLNKVMNSVNLLNDFSKISAEKIKDSLNDEVVKRFDIQNNPLLNNITYGDFKYKNEEVEVFLHQRTSKKVKYKKREYAEIHPLEKEIFLEIKDEIVKEDILDINSVYEKEINSLKLKINKVLN
jgi:hypothetical protein